MSKPFEIMAEANKSWQKAEHDYEARRTTLGASKVDPKWTWEGLHAYICDLAESLRRRYHLPPATPFDEVMREFRLRPIDGDQKIDGQIALIEQIKDHLNGKRTHDDFWEQVAATNTSLNTHPRKRARGSAVTR